MIILAAYFGAFAGGSRSRHHAKPFDRNELPRHAFRHDPLGSFLLADCHARFGRDFGVLELADPVVEVAPERPCLKCSTLIDMIPTTQL